ncbi:polysaccharide biosynthesis protein [Kineothrix sp. MSJ-39]|uniref:polysaccharide biosynthesis protein n=1 Tax=Kineothrix sp. MSJ-39 TaxID=2841533 RepID=UPI001C0F5A4B|nr:nucleoside-diphosphate sugar epimerase/dehydratase [Kineothrix sp. MSJ-39]MBU5430278.1 polysaccharide biosynthesis protein [Kineothrix sp. MSJ-39]
MQKDEQKELHTEITGHEKKHWNMVSFYLLIYDIVAVNFSYFFGLLLRFDFQFSHIPGEYLNAFLKFAPFYTAVCIVLFYCCRLYNSLWRYASFNELNRIMLASLSTTIVQIVCITIFVKRMPISYYMVGAVAQFILITALRFSYRFISLERSRKENKGKKRHNAMIIGAGAAGHMIARELNNSEESDGFACCFIDDDPHKIGMYLEGIPVAGNRDTIFQNIEKYNIDQILFAIPTASAETVREYMTICKETGCEIKRLPGVYQLANGEVLLRKMKPVAVEDLLGREPIKVDMDAIFAYIQDKVILITGGGGSIGSELARQIAGHKPKQLIIFDIYENNAYDIEQELKKKFPELNLVVLIGSVRDSRRVNWLFETYRPELVFHAAAHKHVPLMENSPNEAIKNNVVGTYKTAYAALKYGAKRFVLISTDKAVNPTNIMGASKRLCEMVIQSMDMVSKEKRMDLLPFLHAHVDKEIGEHMPDSMDHPEDDDRREALSLDHMRSERSDGNRTEFVAVRFGNVLGSNGSVIPLFKKQIEAGGPVTVTHPDIIRYFMTIPEAVSLVLQAGTLAWGGEIFVLDMGEPVKIDTLARNLIKLSGHTPDEDIKIVYTGLRPGEKLYEEKLMAEEGLKKTDNELIHIGKPIPFDVPQFLQDLEELAKASYENDPGIVEMVEKIVTTFHPVGQHPSGIKGEETA